MATKRSVKTRLRTHCGFCGRHSDVAGALVKVRTKPDVFVCPSCSMGTPRLDNDSGSTPPVAPKKLPTPRQLIEHLDRHVVGQYAAKRTLAVAVVNHYKRLAAEAVPTEMYADVRLGKSNVLLLGPTGCGKTFLAETLAGILDVPFAIGDATSLTEAGYVGDDVESLLLRLLVAAEWDVGKAERGILYIDEIDKIRKSSAGPSVTKDVNGEGVQQALLKLIEGTVANVVPQGGRKHPDHHCIQFDTRNLLVICAGAFGGLEDIVARRVGRRPFGFAPAGTRPADESGSLLARVMPEDLYAFGMIPEFVGRLPVVTSVEPLGEESLCHILTKTDSALVNQYKKLFAMDGVGLNFEPEAIRTLASLAVERRTGARALRSLVEQV
ncbi:MAG: ATP-dependent Clp protease ATP-binding subunit ClpX, partial [Planctomycetota bacterium]